MSDECYYIPPGGELLIDKYLRKWLLRAGLPILGPWARSKTGGQGVIWARRGPKRSDPVTLWTGGKRIPLHPSTERLLNAAIARIQERRTGKHQIQPEACF